MPRELEVTHSGGVKAMTDEQLEAGIEALQAMLAAREAGEQAKVIEAVPEQVALPAPSRKPSRKRGAEAKASPCFPTSRARANDQPTMARRSGFEEPGLRGGEARTKSRLPPRR